jgi:hypothetical protein
MDVEIGTEATQFPEKEYIYGIFLAVCPLQRTQKPSEDITLRLFLMKMKGLKGIITKF